MRSAIVEKGYNVDDPHMDPSQYLDDSIRIDAARKYIELYERVTGEKFEFPEELNAAKRIEKALGTL